MKTVTLYPYDAQLRPGTIGADFESGIPFQNFTLRFEKEEAETMMKHVYEWVIGKEVKS